MTENANPARADTRDGAYLVGSRGASRAKWRNGNGTEAWVRKPSALAQAEP